MIKLRILTENYPELSVWTLSTMPSAFTRARHREICCTHRGEGDEKREAKIGMTVTNQEMLSPEAGKFHPRASEGSLALPTP